MPNAEDRSSSVNKDTCQDLKGYNLQFLEVMSLHYGEAGMRIERCREDCYDLGNLQVAGEQLFFYVRDERYPSEMLIGTMEHCSWRATK